MFNEFVEIVFDRPDCFNQIRETLTRIGKSDSRNPYKIYQSCYILHRRGKYYICHYKELLRLDGYPEEVFESNIQERDSISFMLESWGLCKRVGVEGKPAIAKGLVIVKYKDKQRYELLSTYRIGEKK